MKAGNEEMLKELVKAKLRVMDTVIGILPPQVREQAAGLQQSLLKAVCEAAAEYKAGRSAEESEKGLKQVNIE